jgi:hypothetical protein
MFIQKLKKRNTFVSKDETERWTLEREREKEREREAKKAKE